MLDKILEFVLSDYLKLREIEVKINRTVKLAESIDKIKKIKNPEDNSEKVLDK